MRDRLEKRLSPRRNAAIPARIAFGRGNIDCIIRNVSETGAKLEVRSVGQIPNNIELLVTGHEPQVCRVVWRSLKEIGVAFLEAPGGTGLSGLHKTL